MKNLKVPPLNEISSIRFGPVGKLLLALEGRVHLPEVHPLLSIFHDAIEGRTRWRDGGEGHPFHAPWVSRNHNDARPLRYRLNHIPAENRSPEEQAKINLLNEWYRQAYLGSDLYPGLFRELQAAAGGMEGVDVAGARAVLEETAGEVLREIGGVGR